MKLMTANYTGTIILKKKKLAKKLTVLVVKDFEAKLLRKSVPFLS